MAGPAPLPAEPPRWWRHQPCRPARLLPGARRQDRAGRRTRRHARRVLRAGRRRRARRPAPAVRVRGALCLARTRTGVRARGRPAAAVPRTRHLARDDRSRARHFADLPGGVSQQSRLDVRSHAAAHRRCAAQRRRRAPRSARLGGELRRRYRLRSGTGVRGEGNDRRLRRLLLVLALLAEGEGIRRLGKP